MLTSETIDTCRSYTPLDMAMRVLHVLKVHSAEIERRACDVHSAFERTMEPLLQAGLESIRRDPPETAMTTLRSIIAAYHKERDIANSTHWRLLIQRNRIAESANRLEHALERPRELTVTDFEQYRYKKWLAEFKIRQAKSAECPTATTSDRFGFVESLSFTASRISSTKIKVELFSQAISPRRVPQRKANCFSFQSPCRIASAPKNAA